MKSNKPTYENVKTGHAAYVNTTKDGKREYMVVLDKYGNKLYLNKVQPQVFQMVEAKASPAKIKVKVSK
jgi:hypothetical protein